MFLSRVDGSYPSTSDTEQRVCVRADSADAANLLSQGARGRDDVSVKLK